MYLLCRRLIDFYWGDGAPFYNIDVDHFSSRWTTMNAFPTMGTYQFQIRVQGGAKPLRTSPRNAVHFGFANRAR